MVDNELLWEKEITVFSDEKAFVFSKKVNGKTHYVSMNKEGSKEIQTLTVYNPKLGSGISAYTIVGLIHGKVNSYIIAVSRASFIGLFFQSKVFKIEEFLFISSMSNEHVNFIHEEDRPYLDMITCFLNRNNLYYSDSLDLTLSMDKLLDLKIKSGSLIFPRTLDYFCWNYKITRELDSSDLIGFINPIINGFVGIRCVTDYPQDFTYIMTSRKDTRRSGMRFLVRGNDKNGNSANFAESEQIVIQKNEHKKDHFIVMSYLQIRGSMPLLWTQLPNLQLNPRMVPRPDFPENFSTFKKHFSEQVTNYGRNVLVNLIDRKGNQKEIGDYFSNLCNELRENKSKIYITLANPIKEIDFVWFDFHKECAGGQYKHLNKLLKSSSVTNALDKFDHFHASVNITEAGVKDVQVILTQKGIFRTNCVDCLDRTNVVQTVFARNVLHSMLFKLNLSLEPSGEALQEFNPIFENQFKILWADNGDMLSLAYSGTRALKSDFTRTGKRTQKGKIKDGIYSCHRFYINNFCDGYNQDCHDYFLGEINPRKDVFKQHSTNKVKALVPCALILVFSIYNFIVSYAFPEKYEDNMKKRLLRLLIFLGISFLTVKTLFSTMKKTIIDHSTRDHS
jgi:hypothetical protein